MRSGTRAERAEWLRYYLHIRASSICGHEVLKGWPSGKTTRQIYEELEAEGFGSFVVGWRERLRADEKREHGGAFVEVGVAGAAEGDSIVGVESEVGAL
jgi:hypothetical protein